ncbi:hypothetical protein GCK72_024197 [Caenorhabditis remanei]|uniref:Uncharacterized protein n=1 Tax=Caenorhabditis remanei TaxID=31234 RepID=A0A6A5FZ33_CAERE|nr:hypothetical protein GCK72_024197 [Caenorhabditis remanei]KAF1747731.1 hypothetical protein GCK72_024197 [Caenorhabditis remanei]
MSQSSTICTTLVLFLFCSFVSTAPIISSQMPHQMTNKIEKSWTDERLCVLKMGSSCPSGFKEDQLRLSVQSYVNPEDTAKNGDKLIIEGQGGETSLQRNNYDSLYILTITTCCK